MLDENCEKVIMKSVQRKYYKTVITIETGNKNNNNDIEI